MSYLEDIACMRAERQGRELADQLETIRRDHASNLELREKAYVEGSRDSWDYHDREAERLEQEYARLAPPQQPPSRATASRATNTGAQKTSGQTNPRARPHQDDADLCAERRLSVPRFIPSVVPADHAN